MTNILSPYNKFLTNGFKFNQCFIDYVTSENIANLEPWWFFCKSEDYIEYWFSIVNKMYPARHLVPFANRLYTDDIVCFDGTDTTGDPIVFFVHAFASAGWEDRGSVDNFNEWLKLAKEESAQYKAERAESDNS